MRQTLPLAKEPVPINPRSLKDEIVEVMQRSIILGLYKPGERLVERELAAKFGVSAIPVREALQELESRGLVVKRPNCSCSVVELSEDELSQIFALRNLLEPQVVQWAGERMQPADADKLQAQLDRLWRAAEENDVPQFFYQDLLFHRMLWDVSGNRYAASALERAVSSLFACGLMRKETSTSPDLRTEVKKHQLLFQALSRSQGKKAGEILLHIAQGFEKKLKDDLSDTRASDVS